MLHLVPFEVWGILTPAGFHTHVLQLVAFSLWELVNQTLHMSDSVRLIQK